MRHKPRHSHVQGSGGSVQLERRSEGGMSALSQEGLVRQPVACGLAKAGGAKAQQRTAGAHQAPLIAKASRWHSPWRATDKACSMRFNSVSLSSAQRAATRCASCFHVFMAAGAHPPPATSATSGTNCSTLSADGLACEPCSLLQRELPTPPRRPQHPVSRPMSRPDQRLRVHEYPSFGHHQHAKI